MINKSSPIPIYHQLEAYLKEQIENSSLHADEMIPSEREFAERFQISRMTVRQAINNLVSDGYLYRQKGRGTFVSKQKVEQALEGLTGFTEDMLERGMKPSSRLLSFNTIASGSQVAHQLQVAEKDLVYEIFRVRLADGIPMALETTYIPIALVPGITEDNSNHSLYKYIENQLSLKISEATQEIEAAIARKPEADHLDIAAGAPVLLIMRTACLQDGTPFEFVKSVYRADRYRFIHRLKRDQ
ncbi:GntR family transcriptional regulator [Neobacillus sp. PS3-34]|uniref:GntR family transcriptional regulator n=1 Tax=Neobacillus sp. PS3-34 TaxID=3070678 RepID=UPI0027DFA7F1|nr:GntR family transcriptional regulator [Neobacillus sp. PS3-34]WML46959.1 GntR family transcriptional regulator [Neobacillus sp. PS3-34]